jgi:hypothetical protein
VLVRFDTRRRGITGFVAVLADSYLVMEISLFFVEDFESHRRLVRRKLGHLVLLI